jgi:DNA polymerase-3 subunit delta'
MEGCGDYTVAGMQEIAVGKLGIGYNPRVAWNLVGHSWAVDLLKRDIQHQRVGHAYLFTGPDGVGKRTLALRFAQALSCQSPPTPGETCGRCRGCRLVPACTFPDLHVVEADSVGGTLKVDQIRDLQRQLALSPLEAPRRIALLLRFHEASDGAANALLKTLEEPPPNVVLLLTARSAEALPATVPSRCEVVPLRALPRGEIEQVLRARGVGEARAALLGGVAGGRPGEAFRLLSDEEELERRSAWLDDLMDILRGNRRERFSRMEALARDRAATLAVLQEWQGFVRDVVLVASASGVQLVHRDRHEDVQTLAANEGLAAWVRALGALDQAQERIRCKANLRLALEVLALELPRLH